MKKLLGLVFLMLLLVSVTNFTSSKSHVKPSMEGTWELVNRYHYDGINVSDTLLNINGYRQVKIYSKGKVMWTRYSPDDQNEWYGYGTYSKTDTSLSEKLEYGSKSMMKIIDTVQVFKFELHLEKNFFSQITLDAQGHPTFSENYKRID
ncbi:hypothetical protein CLV91_2684 [Maribacter vaceletii]|uniref:Lipocalin-like protein n=1 Tax=Maribacter vaceletii TaxID=1206816 RepID=A0A495DTW3_9FLAO|nr:hypothetical protein [Maribacter vaceletii]RKR07923.1 hypothetical protein CLV91_2684 [Maribacter vaceletii]